MSDEPPASSSSSQATPEPNQVLQSNPSPLQWIETIELGYERRGAQPHQQQQDRGDACFACGKQRKSKDNDAAPAAPSQVEPSTEAPQEAEADGGNTSRSTAAATTTTSASTKLLKCSKCQVATYCDKSCQVQDWKARHKASCDTWRRIGSDRNFGFSSLNMDPDENEKRLEAAQSKQAKARRDIFQRVRFYACAYAVHQASTLGRGFLFLQSDQTLAALSLTLPLHVETGQALAFSRSALIHYLTLGEFDAEVCRDDFELAELRGPLQRAVTDYDEETQVVVLMRFRCGHVALGLAKLVPDHRVCKQLGKDYFGDAAPPSLQLNLDNV